MLIAQEMPRSLHFRAAEASISDRFRRGFTGLPGCQNPSAHLYCRGSIALGIQRIFFRRI